MTGAGQAEAALAPGAIFAGDYRIVRPLARGGMGAVYLVEQASTGKARALKLMLPELAASEDMRRRFQQEARIGAKIESAHVVEIHSAGVDEASGTPYLVMELLDGEDLEARVERAGPMTPAQASLVMEQLCHALGAAHEVGIVHRDLKPNNVFLARIKRAGDAQGVDVKVLDFGIAKLVAESGTKGQTVGMVGTPFWMAPEQTERGPVTPAADVWAIGLILYFVLTGRLYWTMAVDPDATLTQIMKEVLLGPMPSALARAREQGAAARMPLAVSDVLARCLARDPRRRFANARELWAALERALPRGSDATWSSPALPAAAGFAATVPTPAGAGPSGTAPQAPSPGAITPPGAGGIPGAVFIPRAPPPDTSRSLFSTPGFRLGAVVVSVGLLFSLSRTCGRAASSPTDDDDLEGDTPSRQQGARPAPGGAAAAPSCRLCTSGVVVKEGPLPAAAIQRAVEARFVNLDAECLSKPIGGTARRKAAVKPGSVTVRFTAAGGRATNRSVEAATPPTNGGVDACLERALSDVVLPSAPDATIVEYTLSFNPSLK